MKDTAILINIIKKSNLSETEKAEWQAIVENSPEVFTESLSVVLLNFPDQLEWFNKIYQRKKAAFSILKEDKDQGRALLDEIYKEEKDKLEELAKK